MPSVTCCTTRNTSVLPSKSVRLYLSVIYSDLHFSRMLSTNERFVDDSVDFSGLNDLCF